MAKITTIPTFSFEDTANPNVQRYVDRKGDWTHYFLKKEQRFVKAVNHTLSLGYSKGPQFRAYLVSHTREEVEKTLLERGDEGARTHMAIRDLIKGVRLRVDTKYPSEINARRMEPLNDYEWDNLMAFQRWCDRYQPRVVLCEETVTDGISAGTLDALMVITVPSGDKVFEKEFWGKDVLILLDWKSSSSVWSEYEAQTAIYWSMAKQDPYTYKTVNDFLKQYQGKFFSGVVRLGSQHASGYHFIYWDQKTTEGEHLSRFEAAMTIARRHEPEFKPNAMQLPTMMIIKVPKAKLVKPSKAKIIKNKKISV